MEQTPSAQATGGAAQTASGAAQAEAGAVKTAAGAAKIIPLSEMARRIADGSSIAVGGSFLHRGPFALIRELVRRGASGLELIKQSPGYDVDLLCRARCVDRVRAGIVALEGNFGLAKWYREAIESGRVRLEEHACMSLTSGLRAAAYGHPFQPCAGLHGSDLPKLNGWVEIPDPYGSGATSFLIPRIQPDFALIHVNEIDEDGNARVYGTAHWDRIMSRAARRVFVVAERVVPKERFQEQPELTLIPGFMVEAAAVVPGAAWPGSSFPYYGVDYDAVERYLEDTPQALDAHLAEAPESKGQRHA